MRKLYFFLFIFCVVNAKNLYNLSFFDIGGGYNIYYEFALIKSGVVFEK